MKITVSGHFLTHNLRFDNFIQCVIYHLVFFWHWPIGLIANHRSTSLLWLVSWSLQGTKMSPKWTCAPFASPGGLLRSVGTGACCSLLSKWSNSNITQQCRVSGSLRPLVSVLPLALGSEIPLVHLESFEAAQKHLLRLLWGCFFFCLPLLSLRSRGANRTEILQVTPFSFPPFNLLLEGVFR